MKDVAEELAKAHCEYVLDLLDTHEVSPDVIGVVKFHYVEAFKHGFKHGVDYMLERCPVDKE
jgi:hypothetical protein